MSHRAVVLSAVFVITVMGVRLGASMSPPDQQTTSPQQQRDAIDERTAESSNVRVEILLTDRAEGKTVAEERLTILVADHQLGRLRRHLPGYQAAFNRNFEVDVTPTITGSRIRLALTLNYQAQRESAAKADAPVPQTVQFVQTATSFIEPGKPTTMIDVTGDPTNRRVTVQVTATIVK